MCVSRTHWLQTIISVAKSRDSQQGRTAGPAHSHETGPAFLTTAGVLWAKTRQRHGRDDSKDRRDNSRDFAESRPYYTKASSEQCAPQQKVQQEMEVTLKCGPCKLACTSILKAQTNHIKFSSRQKSHSCLQCERFGGFFASPVN